MTWWEAALLGAVQGAFMFIPVSSTSHLVVTQHALIRAGSELPPPESAEMILFDLVVHVGTLVSIVVVFRHSLEHFIQRLLADLRRRPAAVPLDVVAPVYAGHADGGGGPTYSGRGGGLEGRGLTVRVESGPERPLSSRRLHLRLALLGLLAVAVTGALGLLFRDWFAQLFASPLAVSGSLVATGILLWWTDVLPPRGVGLRRIGPGVAAFVGLGQALSLMPGLSRSGTTIAFALFMGVRRRWAAEFSFFVAIPTILAGSVLQAFEVSRSPVEGSVGLLPMMIGFTVAALVGIVALRLVLRLLYRARFRYFSYYVWFLAAAVAVASLAGWL